VSLPMPTLSTLTASYHCLNAVGEFFERVGLFSSDNR
jgi:hypothetical protein